ncbi:MAG: hypothetical protein ACXVCP_16025 [Bdellovibrio sp.]
MKTYIKSAILLSLAFASLAQAESELNFGATTEEASKLNCQIWGTQGDACLYAQMTFWPTNGTSTSILMPTASTIQLAKALSADSKTAIKTAQSEAKTVLLDPNHKENDTTEQFKNASEILKTELNLKVSQEFNNDKVMAKVIDVVADNI